MDRYKLGEMEQKFADLIWEHAPVSSGELVRLCQKEFDWKKSTTYTMLKRLCERQIFENQGGTVVALIPRQDFRAMQGERFLQETFGGSLPQFLAAFTRRNRLSDQEVLEIERLIENHREG
ncbi:BlaI/MecI/CopY family transcriptional regulator [Zongyangia hominis]|uniref:BlaI/MecI/CopY family transcriptional regulator n=1 Tax=Zongyangia hominis TaxID=2763677 RepID=A0A926ICR6_9FIRM|nr:BlaI/MecI/CopY family transcriptional regulator [Zongyangia hominis]MBC8571395.1 BlaI/MecI/CopY family transcriptional regulator [Zongyangia hominis]